MPLRNQNQLLRLKELTEALQTETNAIGPMPDPTKGISYECSPNATLWVVRTKSIDYAVNTIYRDAPELYARHRLDATGIAAWGKNKRREAALQEHYGLTPSECRQLTETDGRNLPSSVTLGRNWWRNAIKETMLDIINATETAPEPILPPVRPSINRQPVIHSPAYTVYEVAAVPHTEKVPAA